MLIGLHSSGVHSNGFSLVNKLLEQKGNSLTDAFGENTLGETLLTPTKIYVKVLLDIIATHEVHGLCHITGGGLTENLPRICQKITCATIQLNSWQRLPIFDWIQDSGQVAQDEMLRVFNCGIGMVVIANGNDADAIQQICNRHDIQSNLIGEVTATQGTSHVVYS